MKIEKISDTQIRCTLTRQDLANRHLKLSELAYGTEKAKMLFRDMMQQANYEFGFEADDLPLMIEAVPVSTESIILLITKVEYPEELDTRFSKFSESLEDDEDYDDTHSEPVAEGADDILGLFRKITQEQQNAGKSSDTDDFVPLKDTIRSVHTAQSEPVASDITVPVDLARLFVFHDMDTVFRLSGILQNFYNGDNTLYKKPDTANYYLVVHKSHHTPEVFNKVCNILTEYARQATMNESTESYFAEHYQILCADHALQTFGTFTDCADAVL